MAQRFRKQDAAYMDWRRAHLHDGYVLNFDHVTNEGPRLHRASCSSLQVAIDQGKRLTQESTKICSTSMSELTAQLGSRGRICQMCAG